MAIDRPGAIDPHPKGRSIAESGGRRLFCFARNGAQRQGKIVAERRCGQAIERTARPSARSASKGRDGTADPRQTRDEITVSAIAADDPHTAPRQNRPHLPRAASLELSTERPPRSARRRGRAHYAQDGQRIAVATAGQGRTPASGHRPRPGDRGHASGKAAALNRPR